MLVILLNIVLLNSVGLPGIWIVLRAGLPGTLMLVLVGAFTGWVGRLLAYVHRDNNIRVRVEATLRLHDAIMGAVSYAAAQFLETANWHEVIQPVLARLGVAAQVSRVYIFENLPAAGEDIVTCQRYEWVAPGVEPQIGNPELLHFAYTATGFQRWAAAFSRHEVIYGDVGGFPPAERELLTRHQIRSIVVVPVIVEQHWWGHIGFDQCDTARAWSASDIDALWAAAGILGAAIERERAEANLRANEQRFRSLFAAARRQAQDLALLDQLQTGLAREIDLAAITRFSVEAIATTLGYTQASIFLVEGDQIVLQHAVGYNQLVPQFPITAGVIGQVVRSAKPALLPDVRENPAFFGVIEGIISEVCVPLFAQGQVIGALNVESTSGKFGQDDLRLMLTLAGHISIAIERAQLYARVRASERNYRTVVDQVREVIFQIDTAGCWRLLNPAWAEVSGCAIEQSLGQPCVACLPPEDAARFTQASALLLSGQQADWQHELRLVRADGDISRVECSMRPAYSEAGELIGLTGTLTDVTARWRAEEERRSIERKMLESQKLESLGVLAGGIAHDFNNLLMAIMGNTELLMLDLPVTHPGHEMLGQIQITTRRAADLTSQMLAYAGRARFVVVPVDLNLLVEEITALLQVSIAKTTNLRYSLSAHLPLIEGDGTQLRQVMMNLVINASEALGERAGLIRVSTGTCTLALGALAELRMAPERGAGEYVFLEVTDNGIGMDDETLAKIFDPFFTTKFTGRGLGLAAVLGIVRSHGGGLRVHSMAGQGTTFTVYFPQMQEAAQAVHSSGASTAPPLVTLKQTVLVVDDEIGVRSVAVSLLERAGIHVLVAGDGQAGVEIFRTHANAISTVLLDLTMPHMSGEEAFRQIRAIRPNVHIVIMSGYDESDMSSRFAGLAPVEFLQKPFSAQLLLSKLPPRHALVA